MLDRLIENLEALVYLGAVVGGHGLVVLDKGVQVADAAVFFVLACLEDPMALLALLLVFRALVLQMTLHVTARNFDQLAGVTGHLFHGTFKEMLI